MPVDTRIVETPLDSETVVVKIPAANGVDEADEEADSEAPELELAPEPDPEAEALLVPVPLLRTDSVPGQAARYAAVFAALSPSGQA